MGSLNRKVRKAQKAQAIPPQPNLQVDPRTAINVLARAKQRVEAQLVQMEIQFETIVAAKDTEIEALKKLLDEHKIKYDPKPTPSAANDDKPAKPKKAKQ